MQAYLDVGGTNFRYLVKKDGEEIVRDSVPSSKHDLVDFLESLLKEHPLDFIGISFAGQVNEGVILASPNLTYKTAEIQHYFETEHSIPLRLENDLKCAALAEQEQWPDSKTLVAAYPGTGFGSACVHKGEIVGGAYNLAGEVGHIPYKYSELPCGCGNHYCIEAFCSGAAITKWGRHLGVADEKVTLDTIKVLETPESKQYLEHFHEAFLFALGAIIGLLNPDRIVLGGGVLENNPYLVEYARKHIATFALPKAAEQVEITQSTLHDAPLQGAEALYHHFRASV